MALVARIRETGLCPPSLLSEDRVAEEDGFDAAVLRLLDVSGPGDGLELRSDIGAAGEFKSLMQMAESIDHIPGNKSTREKSGILAQRRCILLALVGSTPPSNISLKRILTAGYLSVVKRWLDDILNSSIGGVDLLLHLLTNIASLPVTKAMVTSSKLGKAVAAVEKHKICAGGRNESAIKDRIARVKEEWSASVKAMKQQADVAGPQQKNSPANKRSLERPNGVSSSAKKAKTEDTNKKQASLSNLIKRVSTTGADTSHTNSSPTKTPQEKYGVDHSERKDNSAGTHEPEANIKAPIEPTMLSGTVASFPARENQKEEVPPPRKQKHIKWADKSGGTLSISHEATTGGFEPLAPRQDVSWSDRKKRDRLREKELLEQARKSKIVDKEDSLDTMAMMMVTSWHEPQPLPNDSENPPVQLESKELAAQASRMASVLPTSYLSEEDVPNNPAPLTDIEQALDMTSQSSSVPAVIPFFAPQQEAEATAQAPAVPVQQPVTIPSNIPPVASTLPPPPPPPTNQTSIGASLELVQAMGLPLFLVGSNIQALQTLAATPTLLSTFVDANGMYDQPRLLNLVQTLTQNLTAAQPAKPQMSANGSSFQSQVTPPPPPPQIGVNPQPSFQAPPQSSNYGSFGSSQGSQVRKGYRGDQNQSEGNLHLSGYGPSTTQAEIIALFSPYVQIEEVVQKNGFCFVNTSDPAGARRAREALNGALLGGNPVRINIAQRRTKDSFQHADGRLMKVQRAARSEAVPLPRNAAGQIDYDQVRDDRGNPATKNLFVAGYGSGTTEQQIRDIFSQHCSVTGTVMKGTFAFVNTSDRTSAVHARESLTGSVVNGGVLRINFAKESGRLGTSFDTTYGPGSQQRYMRHPIH